MSSRLFDKYKHDSLTADELRELRLTADSMSDDEIAKEFLSGADTATTEPTNEEMARMRTKITGRVMAYNATTHRRWYKIGMTAASILVPLLMVITVYLYANFARYRDMASESITVMTGKGERVTTKLPDGSIVNLNYCSQLEYSPESFNADERSIRFSGEGYFDVQSNSQAPFVIDAYGVSVRVLGTQFNLLAREGEGYAEVYLNNGSVELTSARQTEVLTPGQLAHIDRVTGQIEITDRPDDRYSTWRNGELLFHNKPLPQVLAALETNYNYTIILNATVADGHFTGCLPANDLNRALSIIETLYDVQADVDLSEHTIRFTN